jgi:hypothetical protein
MRKGVGNGAFFVCIGNDPADFVVFKLIPSLNLLGIFGVGVIIYREVDIMKVNRIIASLILLVIVFAIMLLRGHRFFPFLIPIVFAHCDTMDGPVVGDAKSALEKGEVTPVLKWVKKEKEAEVKRAFNEALVNRKKDKEAADMHFFETLVRIHREGEGAPFTGLKPSGTELEPAVVEADKALEKASVDNLINLMTKDVASGIRKRFDKALEKKKHKDENVDAGREFVEAYVDFVHFVEKLHKVATTQSSHHDELISEEHESHHQH